MYVLPDMVALMSELDGEVNLAPEAVTEKEKKFKMIMLSEMKEFML